MNLVDDMDLVDTEDTESILLYVELTSRMVEMVLAAKAKGEILDLHLSECRGRKVANFVRFICMLCILPATAVYMVILIPRMGFVGVFVGMLFTVMPMSIATWFLDRRLIPLSVSIAAALRKDYCSSWKSAEESVGLVFTFLLGAASTMLAEAMAVRAIPFVVVAVLVAAIAACVIVLLALVVSARLAPWVRITASLFVIAILLSKPILILVFLPVFFWTVLVSLPGVFRHTSTERGFDAVVCRASGLGIVAVLASVENLAKETVQGDIGRDVRDGLRLVAHACGGYPRDECDRHEL